MTWQQTPYTIPMLLSGVVTAALGLFTVAHTRRTETSKRLSIFAVLMAGVALWSFSYALSLSSTTLGAKLRWLAVANVTTTLLPGGLLAFALCYTGREDWLTARTTALLAIEPVVVLGLTVINPGGVLWHDVAIDASRGFDMLQRELGPAFYAHAFYSYLLVTAALVLFVAMARRNKDLYRGQVVALVLGSSFPFVSNIVFALDLGPPINLTPVAGSPMGLCFAFAIFRYQLLEIVPVARNTVVEEMHDGYLVLDADDNVVDLNPAATRILDVSDVVGTRVDDALPDIAASIRETDETPTELVVGDGEGRQHLEVQVTPLERNPGGRVVTLRDVTESRQVERRYQSLIENSRDLITVFDESGTITYQSPASERVLGYHPSKMVGQTIAEFVHPEDAARMRETFDDVVESGDTQRFEYRIRHSDGSWRVHESLTTNLLDEPAVSGIVANARDVTARKEREEELQRTNERLDEFAGLVSHDLRNPLAVARSNVELGRQTGEDERLEATLDALDRMETIIDDVLTLARRGETVVEVDRVSLRAVASRAWDTVQTSDAELDVAGDCMLDADAGRLQELFENLYRNAVEHGSTSPDSQARQDAVEHGATNASDADTPVESATADGAQTTDATPGVTVTVEPLTADTESDGGTPAANPDLVGFAVADDGPGIPEEDRDDVFESGYSTSENGTGFGLAIVAQIAEAHGWDVTVTESDAGGAKFRVTGVTTRPFEHSSE